MADRITVSIPQKIYRRVRELAQARKQPIEDVLIEVLDNALPSNGKSTDNNQKAAVEREMQAYIALHPMLKEEYFGQHVAIYGGELIDHDEDFATLYERIEAKYPDEFVWLATVEEEAMPTLVFRSPRLLPTE